MSAARPVRVVLVDDHAVVRSGLAHLLAATPDVEVVGQAGDGAEALEVVARLQPDVVLMDLQMPVLDGVGGAVGGAPRRGRPRRGVSRRA